MASPAFVRLFLRPRTTMRWVLDDDPNFGVTSISVVAGITAFLRSSVLHGLHPMPGLVGLHPQLDAILAYGVGATPNYPLLIAALGIAGGLFGVLGIYLGTLPLWIIGKIFGGRGRYTEVRSALAWSFVPYSWLLPMWVGMAFLDGAQLRQGGFDYTSFFPPDGSSVMLWVMFALDYALRLFAMVWLVLKLSVAHRFEIWKAIVVSALSGSVLIYLVPRFYSLGF